MSTNLHPFEKAGLGVAPFRCIGVRENVYLVGDGSSKAGGSCDYCGTGIRWEYLINSTAGKMFKVGCDCVAKTGSIVRGFKEERTKLRRAITESRTKAARELRQQEYVARKLAQRQENQAIAKPWQDANRDVVDYVNHNAFGNSFIESLAAQLYERGMLSPGQCDAVRNNIVRAEQKKALAVSSKHVGKAGERVKNRAVRVVSSRVIGTLAFYPFTTRSVVTLVTDKGDQLTWFTAGADITEEFVVASFTVKDHSEYEGIKQTIVSRVSFL